MFRLMGYALAGILGLVIIGGLLLKYSPPDEERLKEREKRRAEYLAGYQEYTVAGHRFRVPRKYIPPNVVLFGGAGPYVDYTKPKTDSLYLYALFPDLRPWRDDEAAYKKIGGREAVDFGIHKDNTPGPFDERVLLGYDESSKKILSNGWTRYESVSAEPRKNFLYYKGLGTPTASFMTCNTYYPDLPNPGCHVSFYINDEISGSITFRLSHYENWEEIETKVRAKINEFMEINKGE